METSEAHRPTTWSAAGSLVCSSLGCLGAVALPAIYASGLAQEPTGVSAGITAGLAALLSGALCLLGVIFGIVALRRVRSGTYGGRGKAWAGIVLGCLPFAFLLAWMTPVLWQELSIRIWGLEPKL